jgi:hemolysin activation/secretion protein
MLVRVGRLDRQAPGAGLRVDNRARRLKTEVVRATVAQALKAPGDALRLDELERGLRQLNDMPGTSAVASLERGSQPGTTQVVVQVEEGPLWAATLMADNAGNRYTGSSRSTAVLSLLDPSGLGDAANVQGTLTERSQALVAQYALPLGTTGWRAGVNTSALRYRLGGPLAPLDASGWARSLGATAQLALQRTAGSDLTLAFSLDRRHLGDDSLGQPVARKRSRVLTAALSGSQSDHWQGGGLTQGSVALASGNLDLGGVPAAAALDSLGPQAGGNFVKLNASLGRLQQLGAATVVFAGVRGQWAQDNLDSSERFQFGGASAVRAYPSGEGSVDSGTLFVVELRQELPLTGALRSLGVLQGLVFVDSAQGQQHQSPWAGWNASAPGQSNRVRLAGAGLGLNLLRGPVSLRASYAWRLGQNPLAGAGGVDADGRHRPGRLWLQASVDL